MKYILIILLFTSLHLIAQNKSLFIVSNGNLESGVTQKDFDIKVVQKAVEGYTVMDKSKDSLKSKKAIIYNTYLVYETIPVFKWDFDNNETKKIGDYICKKATTTFRGRNYIAWYTLDFPTQFGPWKFNSLPGLILEVYDETDRFHWVVLKIKPSNNEIEFPKDESKYAIIDLKKYVELRYDSPLTSNNAKLPRGAYLVTTFKGNRNDIEIKFEWE